MWFVAVASAQDEAEVDVVVEGRAPEATASEKQLDAADILATPGRSTDELLRAMPGMHVSSHGGTGKAFQLFVRGFDAVHGADVAVTIEGVPLNEPSNIHGHGYLDLHIVPRLLVDRATLRPGAFRPRDGDFAVAGAADLGLGLGEPGLWMGFGGGTDRTVQADLAYRPADRGPGSFIVASVDGGHGVGDARDHTQLRGALGLDGQLGSFDVRSFALAYRGRFLSPGVLRDDDLAAGDVGFYDAYPNPGGGASDRAVGAVIAEHKQGPWATSATLWGSLRALTLEQNYTGWTQSDGDAPQSAATAQTHDATSGGLSARVERAPTWVGVAGGVDLSATTTQSTERLRDVAGVAPSVDVDQGQRAAAAWLNVPVRPTDGLSLDLGARASAWQLALERRVDTGVSAGDATAWAGSLAPRCSARWRPVRAVELDAAYGRGQRPPEIRGIEDGVAPAPTADGVEVGTILRAPSVELRGAGFRTAVSNEVVFDPLAARFVATGATVRRGLYGRVALEGPGPLRAETELTLTDARYAASGDPVPFAPPLLWVGQVGVQDLIVGPLVVVSGLRAWTLAARPLPGGFTSTPAAVADLTTRVRWRELSLDVDVDNVFRSRWRDGEFFYASWWDTSGPPMALPVRHISAGTPRALRVALGWRQG